MNTPGFFGGDSGISYEELQAKKRIARELMGGNGSIRSVGEGINSAAGSIAGALLNKRMSNEETKQREAFNKQLEGVIGPQAAQMSGMAASPYASDVQKKMIAAKLAGIPQFRRGTSFAPGGVALVGEEGPEFVEIPRGSKVHPTLPEHRQRELQDMSPEEKKRVLEMLQNGGTPGDAFSPEGWSPADPEARFDDANAVQVADMSKIPPAGVGEQSALNGQARAFQGFMKSLQDYEDMFGGDDVTTMWPGQQKDKLSTAHRDLQMQLKELYNLGVLNGPDLALMEQVLLNPTTVAGNVMDALGVADMEKRIPANIKEVRRMMTNRTLPVLQQLGLKPEDLMPKTDLKGMSDEELLKMLAGS